MALIDYHDMDELKNRNEEKVWAAVEEFLAANPRVCATVIIDGGYVDGKCEHNYKSVVIRGIMSLVTDGAAKSHGLGILLAHLETDPAPILEEQLPNPEAVAKVPVLKLDIEEMTGKRDS